MATTAGQTVLVLGGGIGGVAAANRLRRGLNRRHKVILVNRDPDFTFAASYLWVMTGKRHPAQVTRPLHKLGRRCIEVVIGDVEHIDPATRIVTVAGRKLTAAPLYKCPAAPYEAALLIDAGLRRRGLRGQVKVAVRSAEPTPMPAAGPTVSQAVMKILTQRGIDYLPGRQITAAEPGQVRFADTIIAAIARKPSPARFDGHGGCFIETGSGRAAYGTGNFYADPAPDVTLHHPARRWHWSKVAFEQQVMRRWL